MIILHALINADAASRAAVADVKAPLAVRAVEAGRFCGVVSQVTQGAQTLFADEKRVTELALAHNALLVEIAAKIDVLPVRLGAMHSSDQAVVEHITANAKNFDEAMNEIRDAVEVTIELTADQFKPAVDASDIRSGRDWLKHRSAKRNAVRDTAALRQVTWQTVEAAVTPMSRAVEADPKGRSRASLLVERARIGELESAIGALADRAAQNGFAVSLTGPWPAYSFSGGER